MADDVLLNKAAIIERCLQRIGDEHIGHEDELTTDQTRQDAIVLNLLRACEASIDLAMHVVRKRGLGLPQQSREAFEMLQHAGLITTELSTRMKAMVGFRSIAIHDYQKRSVDILRSILDERLDDFRALSRMLLTASPSAT